MGFFFQNEQLLHAFQEMPWYLMSRKNQLTYAHVLYRLQNGYTLRMGPFGATNFKMLTEVNRHFAPSLRYFNNCELFHF